jgi:hypothetical protein
MRFLLTAVATEYRDPVCPTAEVRTSQREVVLRLDDNGKTTRCSSRPPTFHPQLLVEHVNVVVTPRRMHVS